MAAEVECPGGRAVFGERTVLLKGGQDDQGRVARQRAMAMIRRDSLEPFPAARVQICRADKNSERADQKSFEQVQSEITQTL